MREKNNKGITLVALIITIMILIMLAAVTIITMIDSGIIKVASKGAENYQKAQYREEGDIRDAEDTVQNIADKLKGNGQTGIPITDLEIGAYVNYDPVNANYEVPAQTVNNDTSAVTVQADDGLQWRVWSTDNGELRLISDRPTKDQDGYKLKLGSYYGYNNGVYILNDICAKSYASEHTYNNIKIRNLSIKDVEDITLYQYALSRTYEYTEEITTNGSGFIPTGWDKLDKGVGENGTTRSTQEILLTRK